VTGSNDFTLKLWDIKTGQEKLKLAGHLSAITDVSYSVRNVFTVIFFSCVWSFEFVGLFHAGKTFYRSLLLPGVSFVSYFFIQLLINFFLWGALMQLVGVQEGLLVGKDILIQFTKILPSGPNLTGVYSEK